jgi:hypothetical protein
VSGRRFYSRFSSLRPQSGYMRISRDVAVQAGETPGELAILSDAPGVPDEELTLALVSSAGEMDLRVKVLESRPEIVTGVLRHRLRLQLVSAEIPTASENDRSEQQ